MPLKVLGLLFLKNQEHKDTKHLRKLFFFSKLVVDFCFSTKSISYGYILKKINFKS